MCSINITNDQTYQQQCYRHYSSYDIWESGVRFSENTNIVRLELSIFCMLSCKELTKNVIFIWKIFFFYLSCLIRFWYIWTFLLYLLEIYLFLVLCVCFLFREGRVYYMAFHIIIWTFSFKFCVMHYVLYLKSYTFEKYVFG